MISSLWFGFCCLLQEGFDWNSSYFGAQRVVRVEKVSIERAIC